MFHQVFETWYRAVEATVEAQQAMLQRWAGVWPTGTRHEPPFHRPLPKPGADTISRVPGFTGTEFQELEEALVEYETTHGDWAKSR
jgi:hypothetical protein